MESVEAMLELPDASTLPGKMDTAFEDTKAIESCSTAAPSLITSPVGGPLGAPDLDLQIFDTSELLDNYPIDTYTKLGGALNVVSPPRASKEGAPWPCTEWMTADLDLSEASLDWVTSEPNPTDLNTSPKRGRRGKKSNDEVELLPFAIEPEFDLEAHFPEAAAWIRFSDDGYGSSGASLLGW
jgi:hypothetical protein